MSGRETEVGSKPASDRDIGRRADAASDHAPDTGFVVGSDAAPNTSFVTGLDFVPGTGSVDASNTGLAPVDGSVSDTDFVADSALDMEVAPFQ